MDFKLPALDESAVAAPEEKAFEDVLDMPAQPGFGAIEIEDIPPLNKINVCCLRGPCVHYWQFTARYRQTDDELHLLNKRTCMASPTEEMALGDQSIYRCDMWWPRYLAFVPETMRTFARAKLFGAYERYYEQRGHNMAWRKKLDSDLVKQRESEQRNAVQPTQARMPEDD